MAKFVPPTGDDASEPNEEIGMSTSEQNDSALNDGARPNIADWFERYHAHLPGAHHSEWASGTAFNAGSNVRQLCPDRNAAGSKPGRRNSVLEVNPAASLGWSDVVLLVFVFLLLLMICFVAVPE